MSCRNDPISSLEPDFPGILRHHARRLLPTSPQTTRIACNCAAGSILSENRTASNRREVIATGSANSRQPNLQRCGESESGPRRMQSRNGTFGVLGTIGNAGGRCFALWVLPCYLGRSAEIFWFFRNRVVPLSHHTPCISEVLSKLQSHRTDTLNSVT